MDLLIALPFLSGFYGLWQLFYLHYNFSIFFTIDHTFIYTFGFLLSVNFFIILLMEDSSSRRSSITVDSLVSTAGSSSNRRGSRRERENKRKEARRLFAKWLEAFVRQYGIVVPNYNRDDYMHIADLILNREYDYLESQKTLTELSRIVSFIKKNRNDWPIDRGEHPLDEIFDEFFD